MDILPEVLVLSDSDNHNANFCVYDLKVGNLIATFKQGNSGKNGLTFISQDYAISAFKSQPIIKVWMLKNTEQREETCMTSPGIVSCLAVTECGSYCIAGVDKAIYIWEVSTGSLLTSLQYHTKTVTCIRISFDGSHFISGSGDGMVLVWLLSEVIGENELSNNVRPRFTWMDHFDEVTDMHISGVGIHARVVTASKDMTCRLYELQTGILLVTIHVDYEITSAIMDELEYFLILGSAEGGIYKINLFSSDEAELHYSKVNTKCAFEGHKKAVTCLSMSLSGKYLVSGSEDRVCRIWDTTNFSCIRRIPCAGAITNAFVTLLPPGLSDSESVSPKMNVTAFKRQYEKEVLDFFTTTRIQNKKLSLFHLGSPDESFDSQMLLNSTATTDALNPCQISVKDVTSINNQMYSFALCDTISDLFVGSDSPAEEVDDEEEEEEEDSD